MVNVICMKWGDLYSPEYINKLYAMVKRNLKIPFRFVCFTDNKEGINDYIECQPLPEIPLPSNNNSWQKLAMFKKNLHGLTGKTLFLNLRVIIVKNIDCFFEYNNKFCIVENWHNKGQNSCDSAVCMFDAGHYNDILEHYMANSSEIWHKFANVDEYISHMIPKLKYWPETWCCNFKKHCLPQGILRFFKKPSIPYGTKIIVFQDSPFPIETVESVQAKLKFFLAAPWVKELWH